MGGFQGEQQVQLLFLEIHVVLVPGLHYDVRDRSHLLVVVL